MIYFILCFVFDKIKNKLICYFVNHSVKLILWKNEWHKKNQVNYFLDWLLV